MLLWEITKVDMGTIVEEFRFTPFPNHCIGFLRWPLLFLVGFCVLSLNPKVASQCHGSRAPQFYFICVGVVSPGVEQTCSVTWNFWEGWHNWRLLTLSCCCSHSSSRPLLQIMSGVFTEWGCMVKHANCASWKNGWWSIRNGGTWLQRQLSMRCCGWRNLTWFGSGAHHGFLVIVMLSSVLTMHWRCSQSRGRCWNQFQIACPLCNCVSWQHWTFIICVTNFCEVGSWRCMSPKENIGMTSSCFWLHHCTPIELLLRSIVDRFCMLLNLLHEVLSLFLTIKQSFSSFYVFKFLNFHYNKFSIIHSPYIYYYFPRFLRTSKP